MTDVGIIGDRILVESLRLWAAGLEDMRVVAAAATVGELLETTRGVRPHCVVLDAVLGDRSDPAVNVRRLCQERHRVLVLSPEPMLEHLASAVGAGALGYLSKDQDLATLAEAIQSVAAGGFAYFPMTALQNGAGGSSRPRLSARENAVLHAYASGLTLDAAARRIGIRPATAKTYLARVKAKYEEVGRPAYTKLELAERLREDCAMGGDCPLGGGCARLPGLTRG